MSNGLLKLAHKVVGMSGTERAVLLVLADEARDNHGGISTLTTAQIVARCPFSVRTIRRAYGALVDAGHITRIAGAPGLPFETRVHPIAGTPAASRSGSDWPESAASVAGDSGQRDRGPIRDIGLTIDHSPQAGARERVFEGALRGTLPDVPMPDVPLPAPAERAPVAPDPIAAVFDAWDAMIITTGLPGPVTRDMARRVAIGDKIDRVGMERTLELVDQVQRAILAGNMRRKTNTGQSDCFATFDVVFEVGHGASLRLFTRLLDGEFGPVVKRTPAAPDIPENIPAACDEPVETRQLRAKLAERLVPAVMRTWIAPLRFDWGDDGLAVVAPNRFHADQVEAQWAAAIGKAAGCAVRVVTRETAA